MLIVDILSTRAYTDISVIIPLYKGNRYCDRLLDMLEKNCVFHDMHKKCVVEVIFVNDHPEEDIIIKEMDRHFAITVIKQDRNRGIHASRVKGIDHSKGEYIVMLDQDDLVTEDWLYYQWRKIVSSKADYCVCNGWSGRFRILWEESIFKKRVNDLSYYLSTGNIICSPGQLMIRRKMIPQEWIENIQKCNGADDFLLWIIILKKGGSFQLNNKYLYFHTPERSLDSIDSIKMLESLKEMTQILKTIGLLDENEIKRLDRQMQRREFLSSGRPIEDLGELDIDDRKWLGKYVKFQRMFHIMLDWAKLKKRGIKMADFFEQRSLYNIAIYGMGYIGECLYDELQGSDICVMYGIDRSSVDHKNELAIYKIEDKLEDVDAIVVTVLEDTKKIVETIRNKVEYPVIMLSEIILYVHNDHQKSLDDK